MKTQNQYAHFWADFIALFFPRLCIACAQPLPKSEQYLCLDCQITLPETDFHNTYPNTFTARFDGRVHLEAATALFFFTKKSRTQHLIYQIKYHDKREAAVELGRLLGDKMAQSSNFKNIDYIIPVPMHPTKQRWRGYNQAEMFANGLSDALNVAVETRFLRKTKMTVSQTKMSRNERLHNTQEVFELLDTKPLRGKNILIVDDVMTTGATLESCAVAIAEKLPDVKISFATIAYAV
ncbi:MAG: phosphoribosyltransferase family protein [Saprospiraceae bacterium]|nr:phosphoribosyltransferase family protein [Saprospiraceae bacterium]